MEDQVLPQWDDLNFDDMKSDLQIPLTFKGQISLSDIISATIGDDVRSSDSATGTCTDGAVSADENSWSQDNNGRLNNFGTDINLEENSIETDDTNVLQGKVFIPSLYTHDSNACDSFPNSNNQTESQITQNLSQDSRSSQGNFRLVPNHTNNHSNSSNALFANYDQSTIHHNANLDSASQENISIPSFNTDTDFLLALCEDQKPVKIKQENKSTPNEQTLKFHVVPGGQIDLTTTDEESLEANPAPERKPFSHYPTFDSDLEDSIHFVEDFDSLNDKPNNMMPQESEYNDCSRNKRRRLSEFNSNSLPVILESKCLDHKTQSTNPEVKFEPTSDLYHLMSSEPATDDLNKSFRVGFKPPTLVRHRSFSVKNEKSDIGNDCDAYNTELKTPVLKRSRSLSEACKRDEVELSPMGDSRFNTSLSSLLGSPPPDSPLSNNPFFSILQSTLKLDCNKTDTPKTLFDTLVGSTNLDVYARERNLQSKFSAMQCAYPDEIRQLSSFYRCQSAEVETERCRELHDENVPSSYRNYLNNYYDEQLHKIMDRVGKSVNILSKVKKDSVITCQTFRPRPMLSRKAVRMMEEWYNRNFEHPYPNQVAVEALAKAGEILTEQVKKWFANKRNRNKNTRPMTDIVNMKRKRQFSSRW